MSGDLEYGKCNYCDHLGSVTRKYYNYGIKCLCHSDEHFQIVWHCNNCEPQDPGIGSILLSNEQKHKTFKI